MSAQHYTPEELRALGFLSVGEQVRFSRRASVYRPERIQLGDQVRVDDFCLLSAGAGGITLGSHIHLGAYSSIIGGGAVVLEDFVNVSSRVSIFSSNDDYSGAHMTGPMVPPVWSGIVQAPVRLCRHVIVGCGAVILPRGHAGRGGGHRRAQSREGGLRAVRHLLGHARAAGG